MLCVDNVVVPVATVHDPTTMGLVGVLQVVVIVVESIGGAILKEETSLSLSKTGDIFLLGVWKIKVENTQVQVMQLEIGVVLAL